MTIASTYVPDTYSGDGIVDTFAITFPFLSTATYIAVSIKVDATGVITTKTASTHYNVSGSNVVFTAGNIPASGETVIISLNPPFLQSSDYTDNSVFPAETLESDLDLLTLETQLAHEVADRALQLDESVTGVSSTIVTSSTILDNADKYVKFNSAGDGFEIQTLSTSSGLGNVVEDITPQLGGNLDLNSNNITGTGSITHTGTLTTTGNIVVTGTVDGRDVATDGTKLDGIEALADVTDSANVLSSLAGTALTAVTVATDDKVIIQDTSDTNNIKSVTAQSIADLAGSTVAATQAEQETATSTTVYVSPGRQQYHPSAVKVWGQCDAAAGNTVSYNVSSITDIGTGQARVNYTVSFSSVNYGITYILNSGTTALIPTLGNALTTGYAQLTSYDSTYTLVDPSYYSYSMFGDQ